MLIIIANLVTAVVASSIAPQSLAIASYSPPSVTDTPAATLPAREAAAPLQEKIIQAGWREKLEDKGVKWAFSIYDEAAANIHGGRQNGVGSIQQLLGSVYIDTGKLFGLPGGKLTFSLVDRFGDDLSTTKIGNIIHVQEIWGGGQDLRPAELTFEYAPSPDSFSMKFGLFQSAQDFATLPIGCNFQNYALCPRAAALYFNSGFSGYPIPRWGFRVRKRLFGSVYLTVGAFEITAHRLKPGNGWDLAPDFLGTLIPVEIQIKDPKDKGNQLRIGALLDTTNKNDNLYDRNGIAYVLSKLPPDRQHSRWTAWIMDQHKLIDAGGGKSIYAFGSFVLSDKGTSLFRWFANGGVVVKALVTSRPNDSAGLGFAYGKINSELTERERLSGPTSGVQHHEAIAEVFYSISISRGVYARPNVQYILEPGGTGYLKNARVLGLSAKADF